MGAAEDYLVKWPKKVGDTIWDSAKDWTAGPYVVPGMGEVRKFADALAQGTGEGLSKILGSTQKRGSQLTYDPSALEREWMATGTRKNDPFEAWARSSNKNDNSLKAYETWKGLQNAPKPTTPVPGTPGFMEALETANPSMFRPKTQGGGAIYGPPKR